jgi:hypothetical protein
MTHPTASLQSRRRTGRRYTILVFVVFALVAGWIGFWKFAAGKAQETIDGWRAREAAAGRIYECGSQSIGGFPFRFEVDCGNATVLLRDNKPPLEVKAAGLLAVMQVYQPTLLISEVTGPLSIAAPGQPPEFIANWKVGHASLRGTPAAPQRASIVFDEPSVDRMSGGVRQNMLHAKRIELHGRIAEGSVTSNPVIELVLRLFDASAPGLHPAAVKPINADITAYLRGLKDFSPKSWPARFHELQANGGRIDIDHARVQQGETIAVGSGALALNSNGRLDGQLSVTVAGLDPFLKAIGAPQMVQASPSMDKLAGALDRLLPGLGGVAKAQASANIGAGIAMLGRPATLEGKEAVSLPLRFDDGAIFVGPIRIGEAPALFSSSSAA